MGLEKDSFLLVCLFLFFFFLIFGSGLIFTLLMSKIINKSRLSEAKLYPEVS